MSSSGGRYYPAFGNFAMCYMYHDISGGPPPNNFTRKPSKKRYRGATDSLAKRGSAASKAHMSRSAGGGRARGTLQKASKYKDRMQAARDKRGKKVKSRRERRRKA